MNYRNPFEMVIPATGLVVLAAVKVVRDWPARRRFDAAVSRDYENQVLAREEARQIILDRMRREALPLTEDQITSLLDGRTIDAMRALGDSNLSFKELTSDED